MKRIRYLNYLLVMMLSLWGFSLNAQITVGTGTSTTVNNPIASCYAYSYTEQIYAQGEINAAGNITSVSFYLGTLAGSSNSNDWTIYMGHTSKSAFASSSDWVGSGGMTQVFSGTVTYPASSGSWMTITLTTPFAYNNTDNLVIGIDENATSWNCTNSWQYTSDGTTRAIYYRSDGTNPDPASPPSAISTTANRPNVQLGGLTSASPPNCDAALTTPATGATGVFELTDLTWSSASGNPTGYKLQIGTTSGGSDFLAQTDIGNVTSYTPMSAFAMNTTYYVTVTPYNANGDAIGCTEESFTTRSLSSNSVFPFTENFDASASMPTNWLNEGVETWLFGTSVGHGAQSDHTSGSGNFAQIDDSSPHNANPASLTTPPMDLTSLTTPRLVFWYQNRNTSTASGTSQLHIDVFDGTSWNNSALSVTTNYNTWTEFTLDLTAYKSANTYVRFRAIEDPSGFNSDPSLDDVTIEETPSCLAPSALTASNFTATSADLGWTENGTAVKWDIEWGAAGFTATGVPNITGTSTNPHSLTGLTAETSYSFYVRADCGSGQSSWIGPFTFTTPCAAVTTFPYTENFDGASGTTPPTCWVNDPANGKDWEFNTSETYGAESDHTSGSGRFAVIDDSNPQLTTPHNLVSPSFDITGLTTPRLTFWFQNRRANNNPNTNDDSELYIDVYDGTSWVMGVASAVGDITAWTQYAVDLTPYKSVNTQIRFRVLETSSFYSDPSLDDITIEETPSCLAPSALMATNVTATSADLGWTENTPTPATSWQVEYGPSGFTPGMGVGTATVVVISSNPYSVSGLTDNTTYNFFVRAICSAGDTSAWSSAGIFTTLLAPLTNPSTCDVNIGIPDNSCGSGGIDIPIAVTGQNMVLGTDVYFKSLDLIIDHTYNGDLDIFLISPNGVQVEVSTDNGGSGDDYGDPFDATCATTANFNMLAASTSPTGSVNITGTFLPEGDFNTFHDGSNPNGNWILRICDDAGGDLGTIEYIALTFETCPAPTALAVANITDNSADISWTNTLSYGSGVNVEYGPSGFMPGSGTTLNSTMAMQALSMLAEGTTYDVYIQGVCSSTDASDLVGPLTFTTTCSTPLTGTYTIGATGDYSTLGAAAAALESCGIIGAVTFNVMAGTYTENIELPAITGTSMTNTITFDGMNAATINYDANSSQNAIVLVNGADYVTVQNFTFNHSNTTDAWGVRLTNESDHLTIDGNTFNMGTGTTDVVAVIASGSATSGSTHGDHGDDLIVNNNTMIGGYGGIRLEGATATADFMNRATLTNNNISNITSAAIHLDNLDSITITGNTIAATGDGTADGIYAFDITNFDISNNNIIATDDAIYISDGNFDGTPTTRGRIVNNVVHSTDGDAFWSSDLYLSDVWHNTFTTASTSASEYAFYVADDQDVDVRNNIMTANAGEAFYTTVTLTNFTIDNNIYYTNGTILIDAGANAHNDLAAWQADQGTYNANSLEGDPIFRNFPTDLFPIGILANNAGANVGVMMDITGQMRLAITPDIGAYEYTPKLIDAFAVEVLYPQGCVTANDTVKLVVQNLGQTAITSLPVTANVTGSVTASISNTVTGLNIPFLGVDTVVIGTIDATAGGDYDITATASLVGEEDVTNDATTTSIGRLGLSLATTDIDCNGDGDGAIDVTTLNPRGLGGGLTTNFTSNNGSSSNYFDVNVTRAGGLEVTGFEINTTSTASINVSVYYKTGTWVGSETTTGDWTLHETVAVTGAGQDNATVVNFTNSLNLPAGVSGIFVTAPGFRYIGATGTTGVGNVWASDGNLEILEGSGGGHTTAGGGGSLFQPRNFSGSILYTAGTLTYAWSNGATTEDLSGLSGGTYTVTVTDGLNCTYSASATINEPTAIVLTNTAVNVSCNGDATGSIDLTVSGGTGAYTYAWSNGATTEDLSGLAAGTYTVTLADANMCTVVESITVAEPAALSVAAGFPIDLAGTTWKMAPQAGAFAVGPTQGDGSWFSNSVGDVTTRACFFDDEYIFNADGSFSNVLGADTWLEGWQTGAGEMCGTPVAPHDGTAAATWSYDANAGTVTLNGSGAFLGLPKVNNAGELPNVPVPTSITYQVNFTGDALMTLDINFGGIGWWRFVLEKTAPSPITNVSCNGGNDGSASVNATGGTAPYTYTWDANAGNQTTAIATGLAAGTYNVTTTDANNCTATTTVTITEPTPLAVSVASTSPLLEGTTWKMKPDAGAFAVGPTQGNGIWFSNSIGDVTTRACFFDDEYVFNADGSFSNVLGADTWLENWQTGTGDACGTPIAPHDGTAAATWIYDANAGTMTINGTGAYLGLSKVYNGGELSSPAGAVASITYIVTAIGNNEMTLDIDVGGAWWRFILEKTVSSPAVQQLTNVTCNGGNDGSAAVEATGGTAPYTYAWPASAGSQTMAMATGLSAGTYDVTATDANNCTSIASVTITEPTAVMATVTVDNNVSCNGLADGSVSVSGVGGTAPYTYAWSNGQTMATATGLAAGTYTVTVTDASGCTGDTSVTITEPATLMASTTVDANVSCNGLADGSATVSGTGGTMPYSYAWSDGRTTATVTGLAASTYSVTVTDANGCIMPTTVTITQPTALVANTIINANVSCNGGTDGSATVVGTGGTAPYAYAWSDGRTTATVTGLAASTYSVTVTDANGCSMATTATITQPTMLIASAMETIQASCSGGADGAAMVTGAGGTMPYTYAWPDGQTTATASNLAAGNYTVTVTDANGCSESTSVTVTSPSGLGASTMVFSNVSCAGTADGAVNLTVTGGTAPYSYVWSNGTTSEDLFGVAGGNYSVTITDLNGCTVNASATVTEPTAIMASNTVTNVDCNGNMTGAIDLTVSGGTMPYTYIWSNGAITEDLSDVGAGTYTVTIRDNNGCTQVETITITEPAALAATASVTNVDCNGNMTGAIDVTVTGGTAPYSFSWDNMMTTEDLTGLAAGTYVGTITDANGCMITASVTVTEPMALSLAKSVTNLDCNGDADGAIDLTVTGGTAPYTYAWDNMMTTEDLTGLSAGTYTVTVTDANGCTMTTSSTVTEPVILAVAATTTDVACHGDATGAIDVTVTGGTAPYTFAWDNMAITEDLADLAAGTYNGTITDANGCSTTASVTINEPAMALSATAMATDATCNAGNGSIDLTVMGGTAPYTYSWDDASSSTMEDLSAIAGTYNVTVTDANGCTTTASATIAEPTAISGTAATTDVSCNGSADGAIDLTVTGGAGGYTFAWSNMATTEDLTGLSGGTYTVTITDANNCQAVGSYTITESGAIGSTGTTTDVNCTGGNDGTITLSVTGGTAPFTYTWDSTSIGDTGNATGLLAGPYSVTVTDANGCSTTNSFTITEPASALVLTAVVTPTSCFGGNDGQVDLTVTGGTGAGTYGYVWSNLVTTQDLVNLTAGSYSVTVTDANGCTETTTVTVTQPLGFGTSLSATNVSCNGASDGAVDLNISGGTAPYTFAWDDAAMSTTEDLANIPAGTYTVVVTDANGCTITLSQTVSEPMAIAITGTVTDASCNSGNGGADGTISVSTVGGAGTYTYAWSNGIGNTSMLTGLVAGTYTVTATDANGCTMSETYTVGEPTLLLAVANVVQAIQCAGDTASISGIVGGGTAPYSFAWTDGAGNPVTNLNSITVGGTYTGTITDANGCVATTSAFIADPAPITVDNILVDDALCAGEANGSIAVTATGGTGMLNYSWDAAGVGNTNNPTGLGAGTYNVTITDANNCSTSDMATVNEPTAITLSTVTSSDTNNLMIGTAVVTATGGTGGYTYEWDAEAGAATTDTVSGLSAGTYTVTVSDANGCSEIATVTVDNFNVNTTDIDYIADLGIFPNPTSGNVTIQLELSRFADVSVKIYNVAGQVVEDLGLHNTTNETFQLDLSNYPSGMYYVRFIIDEEVITRKLILSK